MNFQGVDSKFQNSSVLPFSGDNTNNVQDQNFGATGGEASANIEPHSNGKVDTASVHGMGIDPAFATINLSLKATVHGILFLVLA